VEKASGLKRVSFASLLLVLLSGCSIMEVRYVNQDSPTQMAGGYADEKISDKEYIVSFEANDFSTPETVSNHLNKRASELCGVDNYRMFDPSSEGDSHMIMADGMFVSVPTTATTVNVKCNTTKREYLLENLTGDQTDYCDIRIFNPTNYLLTSSTIDVYVNDVYITSLGYKQFAIAPVPKGSSIVTASKSYSTKMQQLEIEISTCSEQIKVSQNLFEAVQMEFLTAGPDPATNGYKPNIL